MDVVPPVLLALLMVLVTAGVVAWLKGTLFLVGEAFRLVVRHGGEPWTVAAVIEPALSVPVIYITAAWTLARPESRWARWFYGGEKLSASVERYASHPSRGSGGGS